MRSLYIINSQSRSLYYGIGTYIKQLVAALKSSFSQITIVTLYVGVDIQNETSVSMKNDIRYINIPKSYLDSYGRLSHSTSDRRYLHSAYYTLMTYVNEDDENFFHFNYMELGELALWLKEKLSCKIILTVHYMHWSFELLGDVQKLHAVLDAPSNPHEEDIKLFFDCEKRFLQEGADHIIAIARHSYQTLCSLYQVDPSKITVIPNGITDEYTEQSTEDKRMLRKKYLIDESDPLLIFVGRLNPVKGVGPLIDAFKLVLAKHETARLIIAGEGGEEDLKYYLGKASPLWSRIFFTGYVPKDQLYELYAIADIGITPSVHEEFGYVATEMMMCKLPVIVNETTGLKEIIADGVNGTFIHLTNSKEQPETSIQQFSEKIICLLNDKALCTHYADKARDTFIKTYEISFFEQNMIAFYNSLFVN